MFVVVVVVFYINGIAPSGFELWTSRTQMLSHRGGPNQEREMSVVGCLTSQQHASVSQGRICSDEFTCCHTEIEIAHQTFYVTHSILTTS